MKPTTEELAPLFDGLRQALLRRQDSGQLTAEKARELWAQLNEADRRARAHDGLVLALIAARERLLESFGPCAACVRKLDQIIEREGPPFGGAS